MIWKISLQFGRTFVGGGKLWDGLLDSHFIYVTYVIFAFIVCQRLLYHRVAYREE